MKVATPSFALVEESRLRFILPLVGAAACWGLATVMSKAALQHVPPVTLLVVQVLASTAFLWGAVRIRRVAIPPGWTALRYGRAGLLNPGLANTFGVIGLALTTASMSSLIWASEPILIIGLAWLLLREPVTGRLLSVAALALAGVFLVVGNSPSIGGTAALAGNLLVLVGVGFCSLYSVVTRRIANEIDAVALAALQQSVALLWALVIWPIALVLHESSKLAIIDLSWWLLAAASGVVYYALAFWLYISALKRAPANVAGLFLNLVPVFGVGGAFLFLGERFGSAQWLGAFLVMGAVTALFAIQRQRTTRFTGHPEH